MFTIKYKGVHIQIQTQILMEKFIIKKLQWCLSFWIQNVICLKKITTPLENIKFKMWYFLKKIKILFFCNLNQYCFFTNQVAWFQRGAKKIKEIFRKKRSSRLGKHNHVEGFIPLHISEAIWDATYIQHVISKYFMRQSQFGTKN